jgi:replication factor C large subunit
VLICNDWYELSRRSGAIRSLTKQIKFNRLTPQAVKLALTRAAEVEKVSLSEETLDAIAEHAAGDLRSAMNDLQALAEGKTTVRPADVEKLGYRDVKGNVFDALREIFQSGDASRARRAIDNLDEDPENLILWIDENLPYEYRDPADLARGYEALSRADIWLGRVRRGQVYRFWAYASDAMTAGVAIARRGRWGGGQYRFPLWLSKMSRTRSRRQTTQSVCRKIGGGTHASWRRTALDVLPSFKEVFRSDEEFRRAMAATFRFEEKELAFLLDADEDSKAVRELVATREEAPRARGGLSGFEGEGT